MKRISKIENISELDLSPLDKYIGKSCASINNELELGVSLTGKSYVRLIIDWMIIKCGIIVDSPDYEYKMIRVDQFGKAKNPSPFKITDYYKIIQEEWITSEFKKLLEPTYIFFIVTYGNPETSIFEGYTIHKFTDDEMKSAEYVWTDTRNKIRDGIYNRFLSDKDTGSFFFKIHASSVSNQVDAPKGGQQVLRSFWISRNLISSIISESHDRLESLSYSLDDSSD